MKKDILILAPSPFNKNINHFGGQLTAITNLVKYMDKRSISYDILDIFRSSYPPPSLIDKLKVSKSRYRELKSILKENSYRGALVFGTFGLGYWEKLIFSLIIEKKSIKTLFFVRSGHFMESVIEKNYNIPIKKFLMNKISYIGHQGGKWKKLYEEVRIDKHRLVKILNWIDIQEYNREFKDETTFLYVGAIVEKKGVLDLIEVLLKHKDLNHYKFIFVGGGTLLEELKNKTKDKNNIIFEGWLDSKEISKIYNRADVLVLPSYAEGFPNVISEALNYRLPIISTNVGGISESVKDKYNGILIEPKNSFQLYKSIRRLGEDRELREKFSKNSEEILKNNHSIDINCKKLFNLFNIEPCNIKK